MNQVSVLDVLSAVFGVLGTVLLAGRSKWAGWGFVAYLLSNAGWLMYSWIHDAKALLAQYTVFTVVSLYGVWKWLIKPQAPSPITSHQRGTDS